MKLNLFRRLLKKWFIYIKEIVMIFICPQKIASSVANKKGISPKNAWIDIRRFRRQTLWAFYNCILIILVDIAVSSIVWLKNYQIPQNALTVMRLLSSILIFLAIFSRIGDSRWMFSRSYIESLNIKFWKLLYLIGIGILFFTYFVETIGVSPKN